MQVDIDIWPELWPIDKEKVVEECPRTGPRPLSREFNGVQCNRSLPECVILFKVFGMGAWLQPRLMVKPKAVRSEILDGAEDTEERVVEGRLTLLNGQEIKVPKTRPSWKF